MRWIEVDSAATFLKGSAVNLGADYQVEEYASTDSQLFGIAASGSTASRQLGGVNKVAVYIPSPGCTMYSDLTTGVTQSALSIGKKVCLYKQGDLASYASTVIGHASRFSGVLTVVGPIDSALSRVEVAVNMENAVFYSGSSATFAS